MREILFRAKTVPNCKKVINGGVIKNPKWVYGYIDLGYMHACKTALISDEKGNNVYKCQYETIGQYTGLTDKNGTKIFEGDILKFLYDENDKKPTFYSIEWKCDRACFGYTETADKMLEVDALHCEVIGNIYDNPKILEG